MNSLARFAAFAILSSLTNPAAAQQGANCRWVPGVGWQCPSPTQSPAGRRDKSQEPAQEIVRVIVPHADGSGAEDRGSGVLVEGPDNRFGWVLTAEHVTRQRREAIVAFPSGGRYRSTVVDSDRQRDVALLRIAKPTIAPRRVADDMPVMGAEVYLAGYPAGGAYRSWVTRRTKAYENGGRLEVAGHSQNGTSGGPMIDARGCVVSIISTTQRAGTRPWTTSGCDTAFLREMLRPKPSLKPIQKPLRRPPTTPAQIKIDYDRLASLVASKLPAPQRGEKGETGRTGPPGPPGAEADRTELVRLNQRITNLERACETLGRRVPAYFEIVPREKP